MLLPDFFRPFPRQKSRLNGRLQLPGPLFRFMQLPFARLNPLSEAFYFVLQLRVFFSHNPGHSTKQTVFIRQLFKFRKTVTLCLTIESFERFLFDAGSQKREK